MVLFHQWQMQKENIVGGVRKIVKLKGNGFLRSLPFNRSEDYKIKNEERYLRYGFIWIWKKEREQ